METRGSERSYRGGHGCEGQGENVEMGTTQQMRMLYGGYRAVRGFRVFSVEKAL